MRKIFGRKKSPIRINLKELFPTKGATEHVWIARVWSTVVPHQKEYLFSIPLGVKDDIRDLRKLLKKSRPNILITPHRIDMDGDWIL